MKSNKVTFERNISSYKSIAIGKVFVDSEYVGRWTKYRGYWGFSGIINGEFVSLGNYRKAELIESINKKINE